MKISAREMPLSHWRKVAERNGVKSRTFSCRIKAGWDPRQAATEPPRNGGPKPRENSLTQRAIRAGITPSVVYGRVRSGWSEERALSTPVHGGGKSRAQLAREHGILPATLHARLKSGWPLEKALKTPVMSHDQSVRCAGRGRAVQRRRRAEEKRQRLQASNANNSPKRTQGA